MKVRFFQKNITVAILILLTVIIVGIGIWIVFLWKNLPRDIFREDITLEEAQSLVSFPICLPNYKPQQIDASPQISYQSDAAKVPEETYVQLSYRGAGDQQVIFEIYQRYTREETLKTEYPESTHQSEKAAVNLLNWISYPQILSESEMRAALQSIQLGTNVFQTNQTVWWLYEITNPTEYRSTMTHWIKEQVEYRIVSYLTAEEIKKVTLSMLDCSSP